MKEHPPIEYIKECFFYKDGEIYWKRRPREHFKNQQAFNAWNTRFSYTQAGWFNDKTSKYVCICITLHGVDLPRSRVVWALHHNEWRLKLDHEDRNPLNDKIENLRIATHSQNMMNREKQYNNTTGNVGVRFRDKINKFEAYIGKEGKQIFLGNFNTEEEAIEARKKAEKKYFGEFAPK